MSGMIFHTKAKSPVFVNEIIIIIIIIMIIIIIIIIYFLQRTNYSIKAASSQCFTTKTA